MDSDGDDDDSDDSDDEPDEQPQAKKQQMGIHLTPYELQREDNIKRIRQEMMDAGTDEPSLLLNQTKTAPKQ